MNENAEIQVASTAPGITLDTPVTSTLHGAAVLVISSVIAFWRFHGWLAERFQKAESKIEERFAKVEERLSKSDSSRHDLAEVLARVETKVDILMSHRDKE